MSRAGISRRELLTGAAVMSLPALVQTTDAEAKPKRRGKLREYWITATAFPHDLAPSGDDDMTGAAIPNARRKIFALGYRACTPGWKRPLPGSTAMGHNAGIPGPVIRAQVGDRIRIHFRNDDHVYRFTHSIHPHGVHYTPSNDGAYTAIDPGVKAHVAPGEHVVYEWDCPPSSVGTWPYHDHAMPATIPGASGDTQGTTTTPATPRDDEEGESGSMGGMAMGGTMELGAQLGLFGFIVVTDEHTPKVDKEFFLFFHDLYAEDIPAVDHDWDLFNGRAFLGNTPTFTAKVGDRVRWHLASLGNEFHVFHVHGHRYKLGGRWQDSTVLGPSTTLVIDWTEDAPGRWLYHCHVTEHMMGGMVGWYVVKR
jgi:FtsP/CotA-like multicopper oxidase with cupredoxin domain